MGAGRKRIEIDWKKVNGYLQAQCNGSAIASILGISPMTLYRACKRKFKVNFEAYSETKKSEGKELLRAKQFSMAMKGDKALAIWLGKQYLGQRDKQEIDHKNNGNSFNNLSDAELLTIASKLINPETKE